MRETKLVPLASIYPPEELMRSTTLDEGMPELKESMAAKGLLQPVGVVPLGEGCYRLVFGWRRTTAAKELGWKEIPAILLDPEEGEEDILMLHENFQRVDLSPLEEGRWYKRLMLRYDIGVAEVARRARCSDGHVRQLLSILDGDEAVATDLENGRINKAQALELLRITDQIGRDIARHAARENGLTAAFIRRYREDRERAGTSKSAEEVLVVVQQQAELRSRNQFECNLCKGYVDWNDLKQWYVCQGCQSLIVDALAALKEVGEEK